ncbi:MAG: GerAB/ArcD/ProY family transporter [Negativicutes bacterium]|nr:GerAB/ArcD/ProY family transporter [Negativicutes bacterium]
MTELEAKDRMSPLQLAVVVATAMMAFNSSTLLPLIADAGTAAWLSLLLSGFLLYGAVLVMVKLGDLFSGLTLVEYLPLIWGRWLGTAIILLFCVLLLLYVSYMLQGFSRLISFFMFDRTPYEVIEAGLLVVCVYCALQDWGTILRVVQVIFFTAGPLVVGFVGLATTSFHLINIMPLWPQHIAGVFYGAWHAWGLFAGYEIILLLLPLVYRGNTRISAALAGAFGFVTLFFIFIATLVIGTFTAESVTKIPIPMLSAIRATDLPGTYLERLDHYYLLGWMQIHFAMLAVILYVVAQVPTRYFGHIDHRPWVLALVPLLFVGADGLHSSRLFEAAGQTLAVLGWGFSLVIIPVSYGLARWQTRRKDGAND